METNTKHGDIDAMFGGSFTRDSPSNSPTRENKTVDLTHLDSIGKLKL